MSSQPDCHICAVVGAEPLGGWVYRDEHWAAGVHPGAEVPGWIVLSQRRHAEGSAAMSEAEAVGFGTVVASLSQAITEVCRAERVYLLSFGELNPHWHLLLAGRGTDVAAADRGPQLWQRRQQYLDPEAARAAALQMRRLLRSRRGPR